MLLLRLMLGQSKPRVVLICNFQYDTLLLYCSVIADLPLLLSICVRFACTQINSRADGPGQAAKALKRRLKGDNPKMLQLTLTLCEATVKNCSRPLHQALGTREFLSEVAALCNGQKGYEVCGIFRLIHQSCH